MEKAKEEETPTTEQPTENSDHRKPLVFQVDTYVLKVKLDEKKLNFSAYSKACNRMFQGTLENHNLSEPDRAVFDDYAGVYDMIEECLQEKRTVLLNDVGELRFPYFLVSTKKSRTEKVLCVNLKEVEVGQTKQLLVKVEKLEADNVALAEEKKQQDERIRQLQEKVMELEKLKPAQFEMIIPEFDLTTASIGKVTASSIHVQCNKRVDEWHPFFLTRKLDSRQTFEIEIVHAGDRSIFVGVAADSLKNVKGSFGNPDSLVMGLFTQHTYVYREGMLWQVPLWIPHNGSKLLITVDRIAQTVEWKFTYPVSFGSFSVSIPIGMREKTLQPVLHLHCCSESIVKLA